MSDQEQYERAVRIVRDAGKPGLSMLMRGLQIHFNAAARLMDQMEQAGVVTPMQPDGNRRLIDKSPPMTPHDMVQTLLMTGWRQIEIARAVGLSQPDISRIASGKQGARWQYWAAIQTLLDQVPPRYRSET